MHELQAKLLEYFEAVDTSGKSLRQIAIELGEKPQPQKIKHHIDQLIKRNLIKVVDGNFKLVKPHEDINGTSSLVSIPILGTANCGPATMYATENLEGYLKVSRSLLPKVTTDIFAMKASGSSMNQASINSESINDGDYVIVDPSAKDISNGNYVLSTIDGLANIKRFYYGHEPNEVILMSESSYEAPPIVLDLEDVDYAVNGKVIKVIKSALVEA